MDKIEQIRRAHGQARPKTDNPAWLNCHHDCRVLLGEIEGLWVAIRAARHSTGYGSEIDLAGVRNHTVAEWFDHFFPQKPGEPPPFDLTDSRHKPDDDGWIGPSGGSHFERIDEGKSDA